MKEKSIIKFDLKRLKGTKVVVNCKTEEQFQNFIYWVNSLGKDLDNYNNLEEYKEESCLRLDQNLYWYYGNIGLFKECGYEIISYEEALLKKPKKQKKSKKSKPNKLNNFKKYGFKPITKKLEGKIYEEVICPRDKSTHYMGKVTNIYSDAPMAVEWDENGVCSFQDAGAYDLVKIS